jgi:hypothetical protein
MVPCCMGELAGFRAIVKTPVQIAARIGSSRIVIEIWTFVAKGKAIVVEINIVVVEVGMEMQAPAHNLPQVHSQINHRS